MLQKGASVLRHSDESALSIVPSGLLSRLPSIKGSSSRISLESAELVYQQLAIDDDLFTARVYKRNYRHHLMSFKQKYKALALRKQTLTPSSDSVHTIDSNFSDHSLCPTTHQTYDSMVNGFSTSYGTDGEPLQAHDINAGVFERDVSVLSLQDQLDSSSDSLSSLQDQLDSSSGSLSSPQNLFHSSSVQSIQWTTRDLAWNTRDFISGPAITLDLDEFLFGDIEAYRIHAFVMSVGGEKLQDLLLLVGKDHMIWRTCLLLEACHQNRDNLVELLLLHDPTIIDGLWREVPKYGVIATHSPLQLAVKSKAHNTVRLLLDRGASHDAVEPERWIIVQDAWDKGGSKAVENLPVDKKVSILFLAAESFQFETIDVLLEGGVAVDAKYPDSMERTALHRVVVSIAQGYCVCSHFIALERRCRAVQTVRVLLEHGADPLAQDIEENNAYHLMAPLFASIVLPCLKTTVLESFRKDGFSGLRTRNFYGETPFHVAMKSRNYAIAKVFIKGAEECNISATRKNQIANVFKSEDKVTKFHQMWDSKEEIELRDPLYLHPHLYTLSSPPLE